MKKVNRKVLFFLLFSFVLTAVFVGQVNAEGEDNSPASPVNSPLLIFPDSFDFNNVNVDDSKRRTFGIFHRNGSGRGSISGNVVGSPPFWCIDKSNCFFDLKEGESGAIVMEFRPTTAGTFKKSIRTDIHNGVIALIGTGVGTTEGGGGGSSGGGGSTPGSTIGIENPLRVDSLAEIIDSIINIIFRIALGITPLMIIYGGFLFVTGGGNPDQISKGKRLLMWTVIGLVVIIISKGLVSLLQTALTVNGS